ncbi:TPA: ead/Ea22-like family protein [Enterobacter hormaechei subsp. xiangfangensis]
MSDIDKHGLRLAAQNATQGDWKFARSGFNAVVQSLQVLQRGGNSLVVVCKLFRSEWRGELKTSRDAAFIAAANPKAVLALLDELDAKDRSWAAQDDHINQQADQIESLEKKNGDLGRALCAAEKRITDYQELISGLVGVSSSILREVERINKAAGTTKGE